MRPEMFTEVLDHTAGRMLRPEWVARLKETGLANHSAAPRSLWSGFSLTNTDIRERVTAHLFSTTATATNGLTETNLEIPEQLPPPCGFLVTEVRVQCRAQEIETAYYAGGAFPEFDSAYTLNLRVEDKQYLSRLVVHGEQADGRYIFDLHDCPVLYQPQQKIISELRCVRGENNAHGYTPLRHERPWVIHGWVILNGVILRAWS